MEGRSDNSNNAKGSNNRRKISGQNGSSAAAASSCDAGSGRTTTTTSTSWQMKEGEDGGYELSYVAMLARHGARYPTSKKMEKTKIAAQYICSLHHLHHDHQAKR